MKKPRKMHRSAVFVSIEDRSSLVLHAGPRVTGVVVARGPIAEVKRPADNAESLRLFQDAFGEPKAPVRAPTTAPSAGVTDDLLLATLYAFKALTEKKK